MAVVAVDEAGSSPRTTMPTGLDEWASEPTEFDRCTDLEDHRYRIQNLVVVDSDSIPGEFPKFGKFMDVERVDGDGMVWIETPRSLGRAIDNAGLGAGDVIDVVSAEKSSDGSWTFEIDS